MGSYERLQHAKRLFDERGYRDAALELRALLDDLERIGPAEGPVHGVQEVRELLARSYFHSAQLGRTIALTEAMVEENPSDAYAHELRARSLERQSRRDEAAASARLAEALSSSAAGGSATIRVEDDLLADHEADGWDDAVTAAGDLLAGASSGRGES